MQRFPGPVITSHKHFVRVKHGKHLVHGSSHQQHDFEVSPRAVQEPRAAPSLPPRFFVDKHHLLSPRTTTNTEQPMKSAREATRNIGEQQHDWPRPETAPTTPRVAAGHGFFEDLDAQSLELLRKHITTPVGAQLIALRDEEARAVAAAKARRRAAASPRHIDGTAVMPVGAIPGISPHYKPFVYGQSLPERMKSRAGWTQPQPNIFAFTPQPVLYRSKKDYGSTAVRIKMRQQPTSTFYSSS